MGRVLVLKIPDKYDGRLTGVCQAGMFDRMPQKTIKKNPRSVSLLLFLAFLLAPFVLCERAAAADVADMVYAFVDSKGVTHFSNAPTDPRYRRIHISAWPAARVKPAVPFTVRVKPALSSKEMLHAITQTSALHRLDPALVRAVIKAESSFNAGAVSRQGAMGLMQLMPKTARSLRVTDPYDPGQNIAGGVRHLRYLLDRYQGNLPLALAAYNAGETRVSRESGVPRIAETREYVRRVLRFYKDYRQEQKRTVASFETARLAASLHYASSK
jgi:soluble lytic murein transglycosylase-like protein